MSSIMDLPAKVMALKKEDLKTFARLFVVYTGYGESVIPEEMKPWADKTFGSYKEVEKQKIIKVLNKYTYETSVFNELRGKRPHVEEKSDDLQKQIDESQGDLFCKPETGTPAEAIGRIRGKSCITASNVTKFDTNHGLIIFSKHNPLDVAPEEFKDYFSTALKWFDVTNKKYPDAVYPYLLWNCLWKSGASIIHGHMQVILGEAFHYGDAELFRRASEDYKKNHREDYFRDYYHVHEKLGLGLRAGKARVLCSISPRKEKEVTIISDKADDEFINSIYKSIECLKADFGVKSYNMGVVFAPLGHRKEWAGFPAIARIVDRGSLNNKTGDIGGVEMYARHMVIETDPYRVFEKLKEKFK